MRMRAHLLAALVPALALVVAAGPAAAQSRQELDERLAVLEQQMRAQPAQNTAMMNLDRTNALEQQIRTLTGQVEELQFQNRQLRDQMETLREDMLSAMAQPSYYPGDALAGDPAPGDPAAPGGAADLRPGAPPAPGDDFAVFDSNDPFAAQRRAATGVLGAPGGPQGGVANSGRGAGAPAGPAGLDMNYQPTGADPDLLFARGRTRLVEGNFGGALDSFAEFLDVAPADRRAGEAWFWVGAIYRGENQPVDAADALVKSLQLDSDGLYAAEATVDLGAALTEMGQKAQGCQILATVAQRYPDMDPADRARATREARTAGC
jgi:TolA-binding protein